MRLSSLSQRDKRALTLLGACAAAFAGVYFWPERNSTVVGPANSVQGEERRLNSLRRTAASAAPLEESLKKLEDDLGKREKGIIQAETAPLAQAQLSEIVRRVAQAQQPPIVFKSTEFGPPRAFGDSYGEVVMSVSMDSGIEQIINFLTDMSNQTELVSVSELQFGQVTSKQKLVPARITFTGIVPRKLVPEKKGGAAF